MPIGNLPFLGMSVLERACNACELYACRHITDVCVRGIPSHNAPESVLKSPALAAKYRGVETRCKNKNKR